MELWRPEDVFGCCPATFYSIVYNSRTQQALKEVTLNAWSLQNFLKAEQSNCAHILTEHAERSHHYSKTLDSTHFTLPASNEGEFYTIEFWKAATVGVGNQDRDADKLLSWENFIWDGERKVDSRLSSLLDADEREAHASISYDSETQEVGFICWLTKAGSVVTDAINCSVLWLKRDGTEIVNISSIQKVTGQPGFFKFEVSPIDLDPDKVTPLICTITDGNGLDWSTPTSMVTWD